MLNREWLNELYDREDITISEKILAVLLDSELPQKTHQEIEDLWRESGFIPSNTLSFLKAAKNLKRVSYISKDKSWRLTKKGREHLETKSIVLPTKLVLAETRQDMQVYLEKINDPDSRAFVEETIECLKHELLRSSILMAWVGAIHIIHCYIANNILDLFNQGGQEVAKKKKFSWEPVLNQNGLPGVRDHTLLAVLLHINVIDTSTKDFLEQCLTYRNACSHPSKVKFDEQTVIHHIAILILNVYANDLYYKNSVDMPQ